MAAISESYYELEPEEIIKEDEKELEKVTTSTSKRTNLAFNETDEFKDLDDDYLEKVQEHYNKYSKATQDKQEIIKILKMITPLKNLLNTIK